MSRFGVSYHDNQLGREPEPITIQRVALKPGESIADRPDLIGGPYYRLKFGDDLTLFMTRERLGELAAAIEAPPAVQSLETPSGVNEGSQGGHIQIEDCGTAQSAAE